mgnify:CR=1 FL=1
MLEGDLVRNGAIQARADIIVGTTGSDTMVGDLLDNDGRNDQLYGGLGDDILRGGPDQSAGARVEIIDGGEGIDTAVYTGRFTDYSIALNGDGSFTIIDLRRQSGSHHRRAPCRTTAPTLLYRHRNSCSS